jgi:hypothetical protein
MAHMTEELVDGFSHLILYVDHLGTCLLCLNGREAACERRIEHLDDCLVALKPFNNNGLSRGLHKTFQTLSGLQFKQEIQTAVLDKFDELTYKQKEPEPPREPEPA